MSDSFTAYDAKWAGKVIGLYGGSFNPAHKGHVHISKLALELLKLDALWWLVTPGNPLKNDKDTASLDERLAHAQNMANDARIHITDAESKLNTRFSCDSIRKLQEIHKDSRFIWVMGADNLANFHKWRNWEDIFHMLPIAVFARPGYDKGVLTSPAAEKFKSSRLEEREAEYLGQRQTPAWIYLNTPLHEASATALREDASGKFEDAARLAKAQDKNALGQQRKDKE
ncbi:MAG: nicotinate-nucleotide adenylyltransferase [Sphingomonadales bacterium]